MLVHGIQSQGTVELNMMAINYIYSCIYTLSLYLLNQIYYTTYILPKPSKIY